MNNPDSMPSQFPVKIDLAIKPSKDSPMAVPASSSGKNAKPYYPSLFISQADGLDQLPKEGYALIYFRRRSVTISTNDKEEANHSADLEVQEICLPGQSEDGESGDLKDALAKTAKGMGVDTGAEEPAEEEDAGESAADETSEEDEEK